MTRWYRVARKWGNYPVDVPHATGSVDSAPAESAAAGAPVENTKVTEEMLDAGRGAIEKYYLGNSEYLIGSECLSDVFIAMDAVRRQSS
jgi:hypothetical protein